MAFIFMPATTGVYPERSRRAPTPVWRGRPRPRKQRFAESHFGNEICRTCSFVTDRKFDREYSAVGVMAGGGARPT
jgi:hypothetical protein